METETISGEEFQRRLLKGKKRANVTGGTIAQAGGKGFEQDLDLTHRAYYAAGKAQIHHLPVATQPMPPIWLKDPRKAGIARLLATRQAADYYGTLQGGRSILMEAKSCTKRQASLAILRKDQGGFGVRETQLQGLAEAAKLGALVAIVWRNENERLIFSSKVIVDAWYDFRLGKFHRIPVVAAYTYQRAQLGGINAELWLEAAIEHEKQV